MNCLGYILILFAIAFALLTLLRLFEQVADAINHRWWSKLFALLVCPFTVWMFPSRVALGRPTAVPKHEPVRGFGSLPKQKPVSTPDPTTPQAPLPVVPIDDTPPPGTPPEFLVKPQVPPKKARPSNPVDPDKIARLRQKMRDQGMLGDD